MPHRINSRVFAVIFGSVACFACLFSVAGLEKLPDTRLADGRPSKDVAVSVGASPSVSAMVAPRRGNWTPSFGHDLRESRKPRHRSDRPTKQVIETDSTAFVKAFAIGLDRSFRGILPSLFGMAVRAGHPSELLRPPSLTA